MSRILLIVLRVQPGYHRPIHGVLNLRQPQLGHLSDLHLQLQQSPGHPLALQVAEIDSDLQLPFLSPDFNIY
jgi:hypothetical protein